MEATPGQADGGTGFTDRGLNATVLCSDDSEGYFS